jgi:uncharacterized delta-60 repeat protein
MQIRIRGAVIGSITTCLVLLTATTPALAAAGALDPSFSGDGKTMTDFSPRDDFVWDVALQSDGKIVAAGGSADGANFALARYTTNGSLDTTFGGDGKVVTRMTDGADIINALAIQQDDKIVAAGRVGGSGGRYGLTRYNANGSLDTTFGGDGRVMTNLTSQWDHAWGVLVQPDGKIVAVGASGSIGGAFSAVRYNDNGSLDTGFSDDGKIITNFTDGDDWAWDVALQDDGKIVVSGVAGLSGFNKRVALLRYTAEGALDSGFSGDGRVTRNISQGWDDASGVGIQDDGKIVTAGAVGGAGGQLLVCRFNDDGSSDSSFTGDGKTITNFSARDDFAWDVALQADGKIVAAGTSNVTDVGSRFAVARYTSGGTLDPTFGGDGRVTTDVTSSFDVATGVAIQDDGAIVVGGSVGGAGGRFAVLRYLGA